MEMKRDNLQNYSSGRIVGITDRSSLVLNGYAARHLAFLKASPFC